MKFTQIPSDTFQKIQLNAGILLKNFNPAEATEVKLEDIVGATSGGASFEATPTYTDYGEDIDNCPKNTMELKKLDSWEVMMSGSFVTMDTANAKRVVGAADIDTSDDTKIVPRNDVKATDFEDIWWVGDYSDVNEDGDSSEIAGFIAIRMLNSLSTGGFKIQSTDKGKGTFDFEFTGHYSISNQDKPPFEIYIKQGQSGAAA